MLNSGITIGGWVLSSCAMAYAVFACAVVFGRLRASGSAGAGAGAGGHRGSAYLPPVTIFKPLCGSEEETYECLRSFCDQDYPEFQVVFGVADSNDPVVGVVERLQGEFPGRRLDLIADRRQHGTSRKVSNLLNMMPAARHDVFVIADSDVRVERDYLARVVAPLANAAVGIVTCPYRGVPRSGIWSLLGSQFINEWFIPSVRVAAWGGDRSYASGTTIAITRAVLARIGGFMAIANQLADDYRLGEFTRRLGLRTVLSDVVVDTCVAEASFLELVRHELRWLRTIRAVKPLGYTFSFVTFGVPVAVLGVVLAGGALPTVAMLAVTALARLGMHFLTRGRRWALLQFIILPLRDALSIGLWTWSFTTRRVHWRNDHFEVDRDGSVLPVVEV